PTQPTLLQYPQRMEPLCYPLVQAQPFGPRLACSILSGWSPSATGLTTGLPLRRMETCSILSGWNPSATSDISRSVADPYHLQYPQRMEPLCYTLVYIQQNR